MRSPLLWLAGAMVVTASPNTSVAVQSARDYTKFDVCQAVPGEAIARALGGKLVQTRPFFDKSFSRCTYFVIPAGSDKQAGYAVWISPPEDFEDLKKVNDRPLTTLSGLGDAAYTYRDEDGRYKINVLKRGDLMFHATADTPEAARKVADAVVAVLWKKTPS
jgi:hypothetical protein